MAVYEKAPGGLDLPPGRHTVEHLYEDRLKSAVPNEAWLGCHSPRVRVEACRATAVRAFTSVPVATMHPGV